MEKCNECGSICNKFEQWGPYKAMWTRLGGRPWTHILRDNPWKYFLVLIPTLILLFLYTGRRYWIAVIIGILMGITGHVWW